MIADSFTALRGQAPEKRVAAIHHRASVAALAQSTTDAIVVEHLKASSGDTLFRLYNDRIAGDLRHHRLAPAEVHEYQQHVRRNVRRQLTGMQRGALLRRAKYGATALAYGAFSLSNARDAVLASARGAACTSSTVAAGSGIAGMYFLREAFAAEKPEITALKTLETELAKAPVARTV